MRRGRRADVERGQIVEAHVVLREGVAGDEACVKRLQDHVKATIAPYKYPRSVRFVGGAAEDPDRQDPALPLRRRIGPRPEPPHEFTMSNSDGTH